MKLQLSEGLHGLHFGYNPLFPLKSDKEVFLKTGVPVFRGRHKEEYSMLGDMRGPFCYGNFLLYCV